MTAAKTLEECRVELAKHGLRITTHKGVHPYSLPYKGYCVVDNDTNAVVAGSDPVDYFFSLEDLVEYVAELKQIA